MKSVVAPAQPGSGTASTPSPLPSGRTDRCLVHLGEAIAAASGLGIPTAEAEAVQADLIRRLGYPADVYVLALVGGTGVGKSSLLNALAGEPVSAASVRRPTTSEPVAWVPRGARADVDPILEWLEVREVRDHDGTGLGSVAILDLPDIDSIEPAHRERVEELLPKVDAVVWVTDPEKYHDAVLYDDFLRRWVPRLSHQAVALNKGDRVGADDRERIRRDLERDLARTGLPAGSLRIPVLVTSSLDGDRGMSELRGWLSLGVEAKRIVRSRQASTVLETVDSLARAGGVDGTRSATPFLDARERSDAIRSVTDAVMRAVDLDGLERQAISATRARARAKGTGPIGLLTSTIYRLSGREAHAADPDAYLLRWRDRAPLAPAVGVLRDALASSIRSATPAVRPALAAAVEPTGVQKNLERAIDRAVARRDRSAPTSRVWPAIGVLQTLATAAIALSVVWMILWILARPVVGSADLPVIGPVPMPFVALIVSLAAGYLLARLLGLHAGWLGRRWARRLRADVASAVERELVDHGLDALDRLEVSRRALWAAAAGAINGCRRA